MSNTPKEIECKMAEPEALRPSMEDVAVNTAINPTVSRRARLPPGKDDQ